MRRYSLKLFLVFICVNIFISGLSQQFETRSDSIGRVLDSLKQNGIIFNENKKKPEIKLTTNESVRFLQQRYQYQNWKDIKDPFRQAIGHLIYEASNPRFDSTKHILESFPYDSLNIPWDKFFIWEPLKLKIPVVNLQEIRTPVDSSGIVKENYTAIPDSLSQDTLRIPYYITSFKPVTGLKDTTILVVIDTIDRVTSDNSEFPFRYLNYPYQSDSLQVAVNSLLDYLEARDSSVINFTGIGSSITPVWINSKSDKVVRYWLKNDFSDSVTVWIGSPSRNTIGLFLENGVNFRRPVRQNNYAEAKIDIQSMDNSKLLEAQKIALKPQYWKLRSEASFQLNQASMANWVKGGENNIATGLDITGYADYNNKTLNVSSNSIGRIRLGFLSSGKDGIRKTIDLLELNSKLNHKAFGKFDFSGILVFRTQFAKGYNYPNDSIPVSKFLSPATLTLGIGLDYKPNKVTSLNFSPLSYKGTFVADTGMIDQTKYGVDINRKSLHEPGISFMMSHEFKPMKTVTVKNRVQLFSNYANNPQNIDIDWEMLVTASLNWFTEVRFNTYLIYDDDIKTIEYENDKPVLGADGKPKKTARVQFKEMLGFSLIFRF